MTDTTPTGWDEWKCATCGHHHVVPGLARDCERKHEEDPTYVPGNA